jgi:hypothetical protein
MIDNVLSIGARGNVTVGPVPFGYISVIEAGCIIPEAAIPASTAAQVRLYGNPVANFEFVYGFSKSYHSSSVFMT